MEICSHCKNEFTIRGLKKYYGYKLKEARTCKVIYFCSYSCLQAEKKEHPEKFVKER